MPILRQLVFANSCQLALGLCLFVANFYFYWYRQIRLLQNKQFHLCMFWILQVGFVNLPVALQFVKAGRLKALAVTSARRSALLPDVPTVNEVLGFSDYELVGWFGILAPEGLDDLPNIRKFYAPSVGKSWLCGSKNCAIARS